MSLSRDFTDRGASAGWAGRGLRAARIVGPRPPEIIGGVRIGGVITAMVTPFDERGRLAEDEAVRLMRHLVAHGSDGLVLAGTTGEGPTLSDEEKLRLFGLAVEELGDRAMVIAGTGSNDTAHTVELTERATATGVDAVLVVTPYYNKPNRRGLLAHFRAAAAATDRPLVVYNIPSRSVVDLPNDLLAELAELPNVAAVKQARFEDVRPIDGMDLLAGNDDMLAEVLDMGGRAAYSSPPTWSATRCGG